MDVAQFFWLLHEARKQEFVEFFATALTHPHLHCLLLPSWGLVLGSTMITWRIPLSLILSCWALLLSLAYMVQGGTLTSIPSASSIATSVFLLVMPLHSRIDFSDDIPL
ncbi:hypothetical protein Sjap_008469 [Stephania japonica]|uniref:Uncharacterized protein n=1 Tax=Stephania japonica TaxID=461633 RepID=A0AAP0PEM7_9MAGN